MLKEFGRPTAIVWNVRKFAQRDKIDDLLTLHNNYETGKISE